MPDHVWFGLLGPVEVRVGERTPAIPARVRTLLSTLLCRPNQFVGADELAEILWDDEPPRAGNGTLRSHVFRLRRLLGEAGDRVQTSGSGYRIGLDPDTELDTAVFAQRHEAARAAARLGDWPTASMQAHSALALWRGTPLTDVPSDRLQRDEVPGWMQARVEATELAARADLRLGRTAEAVLVLQRLAAEQPYEEGVHALLMDALARVGRRVEAIAVYRRLRSVLSNELGIEPGAHAAAVYQRIVAAETPAPRAEARRSGTAPRHQPEATRPHPTRPDTPSLLVDEQPAVLRQLPADIAAVTGRDKELAALFATADVLDRRPRTVTITVIEGMAGVGKTCFAVHAAHELVRAGRFRDLQLHVNLHGFDPHRPPAEPGAVLEALLRALGVDDTRIPAELDARAALFRDRLHGREALLLLDDAADEQQIRPLIPASPGCLVLVTSRRSLAGLDGATPMPLDTLSGPASTDLLATIVGSGPVGSDLRAAERVADLCGRLPLALTLAGARLRARPAWRVADLARHLETGISAVTVGDRSVRAVFDTSYQVLPDLPRRVFRLLGAHPGRRYTAPSTASLAGIGIDAAHAALEHLVDDYLVLQQSPGQYRLHDLMHAFALELAGEERAEPAAYA